MDKLKPPEPFGFETERNISSAWANWEKAFEYYLTATEADTKSAKVQSSILLTAIGPKGRDIYHFHVHRGG